MGPWAALTPLPCASEILALVLQSAARQGLQQAAGMGVIPAMLCWHRLRWEKVSGSCCETDPSPTDEGFQGNLLEQEQSINRPYLQQRAASAAAADGLCGSSGAAVREAGAVWPLQPAGGNDRSADLPVAPRGW